MLRVSILKVIFMVILVCGQGESADNLPKVKPKICKPGQKCVEYFLCSKNGTIVTDGSTVLGARFGDEDDENDVQTCTQLYQVCCSLPGTTNVENDIEKVLNGKEEITPVEKREGCGFHNVDGVDTGNKGTTNKHESKFGEFPWMIAVYMETANGSSTIKVYQCGGSLLTPNVVITSVHCIINVEKELLMVRAGEWNTQHENEIIEHQDQTIKDIVIHENYHLSGLFNNIALLFTTKSFQLRKNVNTICLPPQNFNFETSNCYATGWGKDAETRDSKYHDILKKIPVVVQNRDECEKTLRTTRLGMYFKLDKSFICGVGTDGIDTCKGDGGSPLSCPIAGTKNRFYIAGMVSWGIGCNNGIPGTYTNMAMFRRWVDQQMTKRNIDKTYYLMF